MHRDAIDRQQPNIPAWPGGDENLQRDDLHACIQQRTFRSLASFDNEDLLTHAIDNTGTGLQIVLTALKNLPVW